MLVKKTVFGLNPLNNCTIEDVRENCILDFIQNLCKINSENDTEYDLADNARLNKQFGQEISFNTDLLKFEMSVNADSIIEENSEHIKTENEYRQQHSKREDCVQKMEEDTEAEVLMLDQQILDVLCIDGSINIKIINLGNTDYYFYTL